eukprot:GEMP01044325.1.p1 GENE.GEMP01044325.1~~GEMP01044325.1.p1  ORF type:complete len:255 (+),score=58.12 GEMP01044325.1:314-1078(+)
MNHQDGIPADAPIPDKNDIPSPPAPVTAVSPRFMIHSPVDVDDKTPVAEKTADAGQPSAVLNVVNAQRRTSRRDEDIRVNSTSKAFQKVVDEELQKECPNFQLISQYLDFDASLLHIDSETQATVLHGAAFAGATNIVREALQQKVDVHASNVLGRTALHVAAANNKEEILQILLHAKSDVNALTLGGMTPLHLSVRACGVEATNILLAHKDIDCNVETPERKTPIMLSTNSTITKMIEERESKQQSTYFSAAP